eukprot:2741940-Amphidinium_carterae.1
MDKAIESKRTKRKGRNDVQKNPRNVTVQQYPGTEKVHTSLCNAHRMKVWCDVRYLAVSVAAYLLNKVRITIWNVCWLAEKEFHHSRCDLEKNDTPSSQTRI